MRYPPVAPVKCEMPCVAWVNTGRPATPAAMYKERVARPRFAPYAVPSNRTAKVCPVNGTGEPGSGKEIWAMSEIKATPARARALFTANVERAMRAYLKVVGCVVLIGKSTFPLSTGSAGPTGFVKKGYSEKNVLVGKKADLNKDPREVAAMFDGVAKRYDFINDLLSLNRTKAWRKVATSIIAPTKGMRILDIAAGTGSSSRPLADGGAEVVALDFSKGMLDAGRKRNPDLTFVQGDALKLPFGNNEFDVATISFGLRNTSNAKDALADAFRVVKPGGRMVVVEFSHPTNKILRTIYMNYLMKALPVIARKTSSNPDAYVYLAESIQAWPNQKGLAAVMASAGWEGVGWQDLTFGIVAIHVGHKPKIEHLPSPM